MKLYYPPLFKMVNYCYEENFTHIHSATPGPIGLAALAISRILKLPLYGTYHTSLPQYAERLTDDPAMEEIMWRYTLWYYNQMDAVYVPSKATGEELVRKGIPKHKIRFYDRGIDVDRFHPSKRNGFLKNRHGLDDDSLKLLYAGRISKEKNLPQLIEIFKRLLETGCNIHLVVAGSGPYLDEMKKELKGMPVTFSGFIEGEELAQTYASSDLFLFPSTTDTFGNVVLEAQASGLPVIVTDEGGPKENLISGKTGFIVSAGDTDAFVNRVAELMDNRKLLEEMGKNAREYMESRSFEASYIKLWESYRVKGTQGRPAA
jgi:glycosyltransferase involved in cell wall biosynthesis